MSVLAGSCHCGAIAVQFDTAIAPRDLELRACQCSFCRKHNARTSVDPRGHVTFRDTAGALQRYRFGLSTGDFLVCGRCGVYLGAVCDTARGPVATLNVNCLEAPELEGRAAEPVSYEGESSPARLERRAGAWTPSVVLAAPSP